MKHIHWFDRYIGLTMGVNPLFVLPTLIYLSARRTKGIWERIRSDHVSLLFAGLLAVSGLISILGAADRSVAISSFFIPFGFMWMYILGRWTIRNPRQFVQDFIRGAIILAFVAVVAKIFHLEWSIGDFRILDQFRLGERGEILFIANNGLGLVFQAGIIGAIGSLMIYWREKKYIIENTLGFIICSWGLIITGSRGAMLSVLIAICYLIVYFNRKAIFGLIGALGFFIFFAGRRLSSTFEMAGHSVRIKIWLTSLKIIKENPLFGVGPGNFGRVFEVYRPTGFTEVVTCAHSNYLNIFVGWGIIGGLLFWGWQIFIFVRAEKRGLQPIQRVIIAILIGFYAHVLINELFAAYAGFLLGLLDHSMFTEEPIKKQSGVQNHFTMSDA